MSTALEPNLYKVCLSGKSGVGKTSIFNAVRGKEFSKCPKPGTDCYKLNVEVSREGQNPIDVTVGCLYLCLYVVMFEFCRSFCQSFYKI